MKGEAVSRSYSLLAICLILGQCVQCSKTDTDWKTQRTKSTLEIKCSILGALLIKELGSVPADYSEFERIVVQRNLKIGDTGRSRNDEWGRPYVLLKGQLQAGRVLYTFASAGADGQWGTADDLFWSVEIDESAISGTNTSSQKSD